MASVGTAHIEIEPVLSEAFKATLDGDAIEKLNAGAMLVFALHHCSADFLASAPDPVLDAYGRACAAFDIHR
jgi:hypothetical protein